MMSQNAVWLTFDLPVEYCSKWLIHGSISWIRPDKDRHTNAAAGCYVQREYGDGKSVCMCVAGVKVAASFRCTLIIHVACGCLIEMNILLLLITAIARVMEHLDVLPG